MSQVTIRPKSVGESSLFSNSLLVDALTQEFTHPSTENVEPYFSIERTKFGAKSHIVVIWERWRELSHQERSSIILEAYEKWKGVGAALEVSVAMGLTPDEARRLGFSIQ